MTLIWRHCNATPCVIASFLWGEISLACCIHRSPSFDISALHPWHSNSHEISWDPVDYFEWRNPLIIMYELIDGPRNMRNLIVKSVLANGLEPLGARVSAGAMMLMFGCRIYHWHISLMHDDVIKWKLFPRHWPFMRGIYRSPVNSPHKGQWRGALMFSLICFWINAWVNNHKAGD